MGGSGGGGGAGVVDFPAYMKTVHNDWLDDTGVDTIEKSMTEVMDSALGSSPFNALTAYDPDTELAESSAAITAFAALLAGISDTGDFSNLFIQSIASIGTPLIPEIENLEIVNIITPDNIFVDDIVISDIDIDDITDTEDIEGISNDVINAEVAAFADNLDDQITAVVLPRFRRGMQDINAVVSSAFPIGQAIIEAFRDRDVDKFDSDIRLSAATKNAELGMENERLHLEVRKTNVGKSLEVAKANMAKGVEVGRSNQAKELEVSKTNLLKESDTDKTNLTKDLEVGKTNLLKDMQIADLTVKTDSDYRKMYLEGTSQMLRLMLQRLAWEEGQVRTIVESNRIKIVAKKEEADVNASLDEQDALWDLEVFQYGANLLGAIGGGTAVTKKASHLQSAIGGGMIGAAGGAQVGASIGAAGGPIGALGGAIIGGIVGIAAGLFG